VNAITTPSAVAGDVVEVSGRRVGAGSRLGEILEVLGTPEHPHYRVRWEDGHESVLYPGGATTIRRSPEKKPRPRPQLDVAAATAALVEPLRAEGIELELLPHRRTMTAAAEARALGLLEQTVAKTLIVRDGEGRCVRAVVPASARLSLERLASAIGAASVRLLTEGELVSGYPQFELGAVPPFGGRPRGRRPEACGLRPRGPRGGRPRHVVASPHGGPAPGGRRAGGGHRRGMS
jgi:prolyl-tRNA editing enzyme YbaK/EbsC (Cys-tRNA(Pro) deacylase)